ncbi:MAG: hypothetical protein IJ193_07790 [Bacilli bacterium]|nr:hypothetical protein [Bacilli bacterium]
MRKISIRNLIIALLCVTVICMAVGFSILSIKLENLKKKEEKFLVVFTKVKEDTSVKGGTKTPTGENSITNKGQTVNMKFTMYSPQDELAYNLVVKNKGTLDAEIIDLIAVPDYVNDSDDKNSIYPVTVSTTDVKGKVLAPGEETMVKVVVIYNPVLKVTTRSIPYQLSLLTKSTESR